MTSWDERGVRGAEVSELAPGTNAPGGPRRSPAVRRLGRGWRLLGRASRHPRLAVAAVGILTFLGAAAVTWCSGIPKPRIHDEFSYLLAADTFAHGRLTNPTPACWEPFESFHIILQPSYMSKYPPAQGLFLALGQVLGHPIVGVWLSAALMCAAATWMLQAWLPGRWALVGGLLLMLQLGVVGPWSQGYYGGAVAACGGALLYGALRRIVRRPHAGYALILALGLVMLANSRPWEGLVLSVPAAVVLLGWMIGRRRPPVRVALTQVIVPVAGVLLLAGAGMGYYNWRGTGHATLLPYVVHERTYAAIPAFLWQRPRAIAPSQHEPLRAYWGGSDVQNYTSQRSYRGLVRLTMQKLGALWARVLGPALTVPLVLLPWRWRDRWLRLAALACAWLLLLMMTATWLEPHYAAPAVGLAFVLVAAGLRYLRLHQVRRGPSGVYLVAVLLALGLVVDLHAAWWHVQENQSTSTWYVQRAQLEQGLRQRGARHLILVRYGPNHWVHHEWVYNGADLETAPVLWAREMDAPHNARLLEHYRDRQVWLLEVGNDAPRPQLVPYPTTRPAG